MSEPTSFVTGPVGQHDPGGPQHPTDQEVVQRGGTEKPPRSLARDAWDDLRHNPIFWVALVLMLVFVTMAIFPQLFTSKDPRACDANRSVLPPSKEAWFGYDLQGCDVYARSVYGARASIAVGMAATIVALILGAGVGIIAGFYGGW